MDDTFANFDQNRNFVEEYLENGNLFDIEFFENDQK